MQILIYEFVSGGGWYAVDDRVAPPASLAMEGAAMLRAVTADFIAIPEVQVKVLRDRRQTKLLLPHCQVLEVGSAAEEFVNLTEAAAWADWTVVIAPEFDSLLLERCRWVLKAGGRLLGPGPELVALTSDKQATIECLQAAGVAVPSGHAVSANQPLPIDFAYPAVWKPRDGAGSQGVRRIDSPPAGKAADFVPPQPGRLERFCPGLAASVACLCGPAGQFTLPPCKQHLSDDGTFAYLGGELPLSPDLAHRATQLAERAVAALPAPRGYLGIDLVLGAASDGSQDVVIEVNPRFTTSYVGLRAAATVNLAAALLNIMAGRPPTLAFSPRSLEFAADGSVGREKVEG